MSAQAQIRELVETFVADLDALVRQAVWETAQHSLGMDRPSSTPRRAPLSGVERTVQPTSAPTAVPAATKRPKKGQKREPGAIAKLTDQLLAAITANPGQRIEHLGKQLGAKTAELAVPVARLLDGKKIRRTGEKRATQYFPKS